MKARKLALLLAAVALTVLFSALLPARAAPARTGTTKEILGPPGSVRFGERVYALPNGNVVVTDPAFDSNRGVVYLYDGGTGALISALTGITVGDRLGSSGIVMLANGNYVVPSPGWNGGAGAVTWASATSGVTGVVSSTNSLVGGDHVSWGGIITLANGNYIVLSPQWNVNRGAVTWGDGTTGVAGVVSSTNSLVGSNIWDMVGYVGGDYNYRWRMVELPDGNYVVPSPNWNDSRGAATWASGTHAITGEVSAENSLVGSVPFDRVGNDGVIALTNGNYVVLSSYWNNGRGAATWGSGTVGISGAVSETNSLVGGQPDDRVGLGIDIPFGAIALTNGNYVVLSPLWKDYGAQGAATWGNGQTGITGVVSVTNSLIGGADMDLVGNDAVALTNGNYVVQNYRWSGNRGALTWGNGLTGITGVVSEDNSLIGASVGESAGGVTPLHNGNYIVSSPNWSEGRGAAVYANGSTGTTGVISSVNSLIGADPGDRVGRVIELKNGNYVVCSPGWNGNRGAITWSSGLTGVTGTVSAQNSLVGSDPSVDYGTGRYVVALSNGNYVVMSRAFGGFAGAVTWANGSTGITGIVSIANSLVGDSPDAFVGSSEVTALSNGDYVVGSFGWKGQRGAATWGSGATGITGVVSVDNSLIGSNPFDKVGYMIIPMTNGNYLVISPGWTDSGVDGYGAVTWGNGAQGSNGFVTITNSLFGISSSPWGGDVGRLGVALPNGYYVVTGRGGITLGYPNGQLVGPVSSTNSVSRVSWWAYDAVHSQLAVGRSADNAVSLLAIPQLAAKQYLPLLRR